MMLATAVLFYTNPKQPARTFTIVDLIRTPNKLSVSCITPLRAVLRFSLIRENINKCNTHGGEGFRLVAYRSAVHIFRRAKYRI